MTQEEFDAYQASYDTAKSALAVGEANIVQAKTIVQQAEASLKRAERNLFYCTIKAPVQGVIVDRRVNVGQTVVASLNAPSLFLIAKDLKRMEVWASVNEADIGQIHAGQCSHHHTANDPSIPAAIPARPPSRHSITASTRNCVWMARALRRRPTRAWRRPRRRSVA